MPARPPPVDLVSFSLLETHSPEREELHFRFHHLPDAIQAAALFEAARPAPCSPIVRPSFAFHDPARARVLVTRQQRKRPS